MAKMACRCGYIFSFQTGVEDYEQYLISWKNLFGAAEALNKGPLNGDDFFSRYVEDGLDVHPCPQCGRIWVEAEVDSGEFESYIKEDKPAPEDKTGS